MSRSSGSSRARDDDIKYAPGVSARPGSGSRALGVLEWITLVHVGVFLLALTWGFGGGADWIRTPLAWWGSLGLLITLTQLQNHEAWREGWMRPLWWGWPLVFFNILVLAGCLNPSFREAKFDLDSVLVPQETSPALPSSARPALALHALWLFNAAWISAFNVALVLRQRRAIRGLLLAATLNALALSIFGTVQKLAHAPGLYFGRVPSSQVNFFASFVYHNHWGAFIVLMLAACLGLIWHYARRSDMREFLHSPAFGGVVAVFFLSATVPLSNSRSCTVLAAALVAAAFLHWIVRLVRKRRQFRESVVLPVLGAVITLAIAGAGVWFVARDSIAARFAKTQEQLAEMRARGSVGDRAELYRNTWRMAWDKPWFGWGMASYPHVFTLYNTQSSVDRLPVFYRDAHSDWLQALAEHGFVGSALLGLCVLVPLLRLRRRHFTSPLPGYILAGCCLIGLYAWLEFPFGNIAVVFAWWLCFFAAIQYARLQDRESSPAARPA